MRNILVLISFLVAGCSSLSPSYDPGINTYSFQHNLNSNGNFINSNLIHTYNTVDLEANYKKGFCGGMSDCNTNIENTKNNSMFGGFDLNNNPISKNHYGITSIDLYRVLYTTTGQLQEQRTVSGALFIPNMPKNQIKGVILFFHPTFFSRTSVPSYAPDKGTDQAIAAVFVANGYIVVAPDYIGMGYDKTTFHPYVLYPEVNAEDGLSALDASTTFLRQQGYFTNSKTKLFVTGYSEGGAYALWFSRLAQEQKNFKTKLNNLPYNLKMVAPISGAYNLSSVTNNYLFSDIGVWNKSNFHVQSSIMAAKLKPALLAYTLTSYGYYSEGSTYSKVFNIDFFNMECTLQYSSECAFNSHKRNLFEAFTEEKDDFVIVNKIDNAAAYKSGYGGMAMNQWNDISPLINPQLLKSSKFQTVLREGDIYSWHSVMPTTLIYLKYDSVVSNYNSILALRGMQEHNSKNVTAIEVDNSIAQENVVSILPGFDIDHITGFYYLYLVALNQFNQSI